MVNATLTEEEKSGYRALIGSMGWVTRQSRPDVMVNVSLASQDDGLLVVLNKGFFETLCPSTPMHSLGTSTVQNG